MSYFPPIQQQTNKKPPRKSSNQEDVVGISSRMTRIEEENAILRAEIERSSEERRSLHKAVRALSSLLEKDAKDLTTLKGDMNLQRKETKTLMSLVRDTLKNDAFLEELGEIRRSRTRRCSFC